MAHQPPRADVLAGGLPTRPSRGRPRLLVVNVEDLDLPDRRARVRRKDLTVHPQNMGNYCP